MDKVSLSSAPTHTRTRIGGVTEPITRLTQYTQTRQFNQCKRLSLPCEAVVVRTTQQSPQVISPPGIKPVRCLLPIRMQTKYTTVHRDPNARCLLPGNSILLAPGKSMLVRGRPERSSHKQAVPGMRALEQNRSRWMAL
jgi:hypothetical protein